MKLNRMLHIFAFCLILLAPVFLLNGNAGASDPPSPYDVPQHNPQTPQVNAFALPPGAVTFANGTNTGPPPNVKLYVPSINPDTPVVVFVLITRPPNGGPLHLLHFATADGVHATIDLTRLTGYEDCFGGSPFLSDFSRTIKAMVNCKRNDTGNGNDRVVFPVDSGIPARDPWDTEP